MFPRDRAPDHCQHAGRGTGYADDARMLVVEDTVRRSTDDRIVGQARTADEHATDRLGIQFGQGEALAVNAALVVPAADAQPAGRRRGKGM